MTPGWKDSIRRRPALFHAAKATQAVVGGARRALWRSARGPVIAHYLAGPRPHGLALGAGHHPPAGWLATDLDPTVAPGVIFLDVTERFPFPDASLDYVHGEHLIEHVPLADGRTLLAEAHRVLRPGGRLRLATPDLAKLAALVTDGGRSPEGAAYVSWIASTFVEDGRIENRPVDVLNNAMRAWGHAFLYDEATLRDELVRAGFGAVTRWTMNESDDPRLRGLETHAQTVGGEAHVRWETMVLEAVPA